MTKDLRWAVDGPPLGIWATVSGTADLLMQEALGLLPDGSGFLENRSVLRGVERVPVVWTHVAPGLLSLAVLYPEDSPDEEPLWQSVRYGCAVVRIDAGGAEVAVLRNIDDATFWNLSGPIGFVGPAKQCCVLKQ
jgi:hypothetical protein